MPALPNLLVAILTILHILVRTNSQLPQAFAIVRNIQPWLTYQNYLSSMGQPTFNSNTNIQAGYNMISLAGFTESMTYQGLDGQISPLMVWKKVYEIVMGGKPTIYGTSNRQVQQHIIHNVFHLNGSKLLMHVDLENFPVSGPVPASPASLAQQLVTTATELQLDGISLYFTDYNAVKDNTASDWLETVLRYIKTNTQNTDMVTVLIIPPTFVSRMRIFKSMEIGSLVDYFVLKYYGTVQPDYTSYQSLFQTSAFYPETSMFELLKKSDIYLDICRTLIANPTDQTGSWNYMQFLNPNDLNNAFMQAYSKMGWFGGFANLNFEADKDTAFVNTALSGVRDQCIRNQNCFC